MAYDFKDWHEDPSNRETWLELMRAGISKRMYQPKPCRQCGETFVPRGGRAVDCDDCLSPGERLFRQRRREESRRARAQEAAETAEKGAIG